MNFYKKKSYFLEIDKFLVMFLLPGGSSVTFINCSLLADINKLAFEPVFNLQFPLKHKTPTGLKRFI